MFEKWVVRRQKLNRKVVVRLTEETYQKLLGFIQNNAKFPTISSYIRALIVDQLSGQTDTGREKTT